MNYYLDTCIWIDFIENRYDRMNPIGEYAFLFLKKCRKKNKIILYSNHTIYELNRTGYDFFELSKDFKKVLKKVEIKNIDLVKANEIKKINFIPFGDALHLILTRKNNGILVSRDNHLLDFKKTKLPEKLI